MTKAADTSPIRADRAIGVWLLVCAAMVFAMAVIGAVTRLTESGLSMVEWKPLIGLLPPLSEAEWQRVFDLYRATPEYRYVNAGMTLEAFRGIFWWEWFHRLWGQLIGVAFAVPFAWFALRGRIAPELRPRLVGLLLLGGAQGVVGWLMVESGLVDRPSVSHYRLAIHLGMAFVIYGLLLWTALGLVAPGRGAGPSFTRRRTLRRHAAAALGLVGLTVVWGAFVAGLDAGAVYNTFPLMAGRWVPAEIDTLRPWWLNPFENTAAVQFVHRWLAVGTGLAVLALAASVWRAGPARRGRTLAAALAGMVLAQIGLGVATLLLAVPVPLGAAHQAGALALVTLLVWLRHELREPDTAARC